MIASVLPVYSEEDEEEEEEEEEFDEEAYLEAQRKALEEEQLMEAVSVAAWD